MIQHCIIIIIVVVIGSWYDFGTCAVAVARAEVLAGKCTSQYDDAFVFFFGTKRESKIVAIVWTLDLIAPCRRLNKEFPHFKTIRHWAFSSGLVLDDAAQRIHWRRCQQSDIFGQNEVVTADARNGRAKGKGLQGFFAFSFHSDSSWFLFDSKFLCLKARVIVPRYAKSPINSRTFRFIWLSRASGYAQRDRQQNSHFTCATLPGSQNISRTSWQLPTLCNLMQSFVNTRRRSF